MLLTSDEVDAFLIKMRKQPCSWCGSLAWGTHIETAPDVAALRSLPRIRIHQEGDSLKGTVTVGTEDALVVAVTECADCGHIDTFSYFSIVKKVRAQQAAEKENGNNPQN